tara:strand:- start:368 stop:499 length:132 start_codon:yes stop_codon:yes gene_type:complete
MLRDQIIGEDIVLILMKLNSGREDLPDYMIELNIFWIKESGIK